ncbi:MAG: RNA methyltransferase [Cucumibacter sp.]
MSNRPLRPANRRPGATPDGPLYIYGLHPVRAALDNPARRKRGLLSTPNALRRLAESGPLPSIEVKETSPRELDRLLGADAVHQGVALKVDPLPRKPIGELAGASLVVVLDQITDPHNVGAILRTACAFGANALLTTARHAPRETSVLAKSASGALDMMDFIEVRNLAEAIDELKGLGFTCLGFDSEAGEPLRPGIAAPKVALLLGAEGKGLRQKTRSMCDRLLRLETPGPIKSLNVSNAAAIALFAVTAGTDN